MILDPADTNHLAYEVCPRSGAWLATVSPLIRMRGSTGNIRFMEADGKINTSMLQYVIDQTLKALNTYQKLMNGSNALYFARVDKCKRKLA